MDDSVYHHKRTLQYVRLGKVLPDSRVRPRAKRRAVISFTNGAAAETSNCKCKITLRSGDAWGDNNAQIIFGVAALSCHTAVARKAGWARSSVLTVAQFSQVLQDWHFAWLLLRWLSAKAALNRLQIKKHVFNTEETMTRVTHPLIPGWFDF